MITETPWFVPLVWAGLYTSDFCFTMACARVYQAQSTVVFEGSYEITPMFQADVNALRRISPRFIALLVASTAYVWWMADLNSKGQTRDLFDVVIGALVLVQLTVHVRHLRNWFLFRAVRQGRVTGRIEYSRHFMLRASAFDLVSFSGLYATLFVLTDNLFVLGGAIACAFLAMNHYRLARRHDATRVTGVSRAA